MATRKEKRTGFILGVVGSLLLFGFVLQEGLDIPPPVIPAAILALGGGIAGLRLARRFGTKNDTVIYHLKRRGRVVYVGIAYARRIGMRVHEHKKSGKKFDAVKIGKARPRKEARLIEARRIRRKQPKYNIAGK